MINPLYLPQKGGKKNHLTKSLSKASSNGDARNLTQTQAPYLSSSLQVFFNEIKEKQSLLQKDPPNIVSSK